GLSTATAPDGSYALNNLPSGQITVLAALTGYQSGSASVSVVASATTYAPAITLVSGSGTISGTVKNSTGAAITGASVGYGGGTVATDSYGNYTLAGVPVGNVQLVAAANGFQSATQNVAVYGGKTIAANFALAAAITNGTVTGKITNVSNGAILAGTTVTWSGGSTTSNASGIYTLTNVPAGTQNITANKAGYLPRTLAATVTGDASTILNIPVATGGKIAVKVVAPSGAVVSGATITIKGGNVATAVTAATSTAGLFTTNWISIGTYTVSIVKTGHTTQTKTIAIASGATGSLTFTGF
ncbi:MAG TPA: carboxypeptidase regulatory-like domain-containing protein, partial [Candidatus Angelobacter sp.]